MIKIDNIDIAAQLFALQDKAYADFQSKLLPTVIYCYFLTSLGLTPNWFLT